MSRLFLANLEINCSVHVFDSLKRFFRNLLCATSWIISGKFFLSICFASFSLANLRVSSAKALSFIAPNGIISLIFVFLKHRFWCIRSLKRCFERCMWNGNQEIEHETNQYLKLVRSLFKAEFSIACVFAHFMAQFFNDWECTHQVIEIFYRCTVSVQCRR